MGLFSKRKLIPVSEHSPLRVLGWQEVRMLDPSLTPDGVEAAVTMVEAANAQTADQLGEFLDRPEIEDLLRTLIPGLLPLGGFPAEPDDVAVDFSAGWMVADTESCIGLAARGQISKAARLALSMLKTSPESRDFAPATWAFLDLGYCTNRLALTPAQALDGVMTATRNSSAS